MAKPSREPTQFSVLVGERRVEADLDREAAFDTASTGLDQALAETPARYGWWAVLEAEAEFIADGLEDALEAKWAELYERYELLMTRPEGESGKRVKPTVESIKAAVTRAVEYQELQTRLREAQRAHRLMRAAVRTMDRRQDAVLAVASNYRAELDARVHDRLKELPGQKIRDRVRARGI